MQRIDDEPEPVFFEIASELAAQECDGPMRFEIIREEQARVILPSKMPEEPLLGDALRNVSERARLDAAEGAARRLVGLCPVTFTLRLCEHRPKPMLHAREETRRSLIGLRRVIIVWYFAIKLVPILTDRHQVHVHSQIRGASPPRIPRRARGAP